MTSICEQEQDITEEVTETEGPPEASPEWDALAAEYGLAAGADTEALLTVLRHRAKAPRDVTYASLVATLDADHEDQANDAISGTGPGPGAPDGDEPLEAAQEPPIDPPANAPDDGDDSA